MADSTFYNRVRLAVLNRADEMDLVFGYTGIAFTDPECPFKSTSGKTLDRGRFLS